MTPEKIAQERQKFEAWMTAQNPANPQIERVGNEYSRLGTQYKFEGWLARAAQSEWISVDERLPENDPCLMSKGSIGTNREYFVYPNPLMKFSAMAEPVIYAYRSLDETGKYVWGNKMTSPTVIFKNITHWQPVNFPTPPTEQPAE